MEDSKTLMHPNSQHCAFVVAEKSVKLINALDNFGDVSHVENVVALGRSREEIVGNIFKQV